MVQALSGVGSWCVVRVSYEYENKMLIRVKYILCVSISVARTAVYQVNVKVARREDASYIPLAAG